MKPLLLYLFYLPIPADSLNEEKTTEIKMFKQTQCHGGGGEGSKVQPIPNTHKKIQLILGKTPKIPEPNQQRWIPSLERILDAKIPAMEGLRCLDFLDPPALTFPESSTGGWNPLWRGFCLGGTGPTPWGHLPSRDLSVESIKSKFWVKIWARGVQVEGNEVMMTRSGKGDGILLLLGRMKWLPRQEDLGTHLNQGAMELFRLEKKPPRSADPAVSPAPRVFKCHIHLFFGHLRGCWSHHSPGQPPAPSAAPHRTNFPAPKFRKTSGSADRRGVDVPVRLSRLGTQRIHHEGKKSGTKHFPHHLKDNRTSAECYQPVHAGINPGNENWKQSGSSGKCWGSAERENQGEKSDKEKLTKHKGHFLIPCLSVEVGMSFSLSFYKNE